MDPNAQQQNSGLPISQNINQAQMFSFVPVAPGILSFQFDGAFQSPLMTQGTGMVSPNIINTRQEAEVSSKGKKRKTKEANKDLDKSPKERVYKCNRCHKSYLSYPALYTHTKLKHVHAKDSSSITNGRMRGRPKKATVYLLVYLDCQW